MGPGRLQLIREVGNISQRRSIPMGSLGFLTMRAHYAPGLALPRQRVPMFSGSRSREQRIWLAADRPTCHNQTQWLIQERSQTWAPLVMPGYNFALGLQFYVVIFIFRSLPGLLTIALKANMTKKRRKLLGKQPGFYNLLLLRYSLAS